ncbi:MAG: hypothetical protein EAZ85_13925, partial [Bacteroidetes bacterium]
MKKQNNKRNSGDGYSSDKKDEFKKDYKKSFGGNNDKPKRSFGGENNSGERKSFGEKREFKPRTEGGSYGGERKSYGERKSFGEKREFKPRT